MATRALTVVIPAFNSAPHVERTLAALGAALERALGFDAEVLLVDDGSTDGTAAAAAAAGEGRLALRVISQPNRGRFEARRAGLEAARGDWILLLDSRVTLHADSLRFVAERLDAGEEVWNGHVVIDDGGNPLAAFMRLLGALAWPDYLDDPRATSYGVEDFDRYPKGTGCFLAPTAALREAVSAFRSRYADVRQANDDTPLIRSIAEQRRIHLSPAFACEYEARGSLRAFARHSVHRGVVFVDGHGRRESRFFPVVIGFYPLSAALSILSLRRPRIAALTAVGVGAAAATLGIKRRRSLFEIAVLGLVTPVYAAGHGLGMWKGLTLLLRRRSP